ncbi:hypothetical protein HHK36_023975 [Tetracentron sinense]|uniref:Pectinesterase n=1 Tax=Tetracentron sinense TaxID=13715 RepID=A0A835D5P9_TETSI|nr:hypothetical protein HHK36_023975 [Tetracentron sinense]
MDLPGFALYLMVLVTLLGTHLGSCMGHEHSSRSFIAWEDMRWEDQWRRLRLDDGHNVSQVIIVNKDGRGDSNTVQGAVDLVPDHNSKRVKILIPPGIYREKVYVPSNKPYISFIGNPNSETVITWNDKASNKDANGREMGTRNSASVTVASDYFCATGITFENTIVANGGRGMQSVALRIFGDKAMFYKVRFVGAQDTLLDQEGTHYFYHCFIQGTVDFIFGNGRSLYEDCILHSTAKRSGAIAASKRDSEDDNTGFSFVNCTVNGTGRIYLGRAWGRYSRAIYSYCNISDIIRPPGWSEWGDSSKRQTAVFAEYQCIGRGANLKGRASWAKSFSHEEARPFLDRDFIDGNQWLRL